MERLEIDIIQKNFEKYYEDSDIWHEMTIRYTPHQNFICERTNRKKYEDGKIFF